MGLGLAPGPAGHPDHLELHRKKKILGFVFFNNLMTIYVKHFHVLH